MSQIDWSKAPEGATHWDSRGNACSLGFMKPGLRKGEWEYFGCGGHWVLYGMADSKLLEAMMPRPTTWSGEGLPPIGTVCNAYYSGMNQGVVRVEYIGKNACVLYSLERHEEQCSMTDRYSFFPLRTPEQIAAEERLHKIRNAFTAIAKAIAPHQGPCGCEAAIRVAVEAMIDAGYRKTEGGAA